MKTGNSTGETTLAHFGLFHTLRSGLPLAMACGLVLLGPWLGGSARDTPPGIAGDWSGTLSAGGAKLELVLHVAEDAGGTLSVTLDSINQGVKGLKGADVTLHGDHFDFKIPAVHGSYDGTISVDGKSIDGTWSQGSPLPLKFVRGAPTGAAAAPSAPAMLPARPPVPLAQLQSVLDQEFQPLLKSGVLAQSTGGGIVIGILDHGQRRIFAFGTAKPDSIFEIGSITKTFTALALAQMVEQKKVALSDTVRSLLPSSAAIPKPAGPEITLLDLATQHSGLPRLPDNLHPAKGIADPYADYHAAQLYAFLDKHGVAVPPDAKFLYSNLGFGLLGYALSTRASVSYDRLIETEVTAPLHLHDTTVALSPEQEKRFIQGHNATNAPVGPWNFDVMAGGGALRSTADDMLTYLEAQMHPEKFGSANATAGSPAATLPAAIEMTHELRADGPPGMKIGLAWIHADRTGNYWHDGGTGGYTSFAFFSPKNDRAVVVLYNREDIGSTAVPFVDRVTANVSALLEGQPAMKLEP